MSTQVCAAAAAGRSPVQWNTDAKRFYEGNGYQQVGEIPNLYRPGATETMMAKDLKK